MLVFRRRGVHRMVSFDDEIEQIGHLGHQSTFSSR
jgi:hypothetical protein